jgi:quercetin dioxygenase-like cupin family protein
MQTPSALPRVLLRSEQSDGRVSVIESAMPPGANGPSLHTHEFDETFYVLEGELTVQLGREVTRVGAGELAFALGGIAHTLANHGANTARFLIICTPAGFEREFARRAAARVGDTPPPWARKQIPDVTVVGPRSAKVRHPARCLSQSEIAGGFGPRLERGSVQSCPRIRSDGGCALRSGSRSSIVASNPRR